MSSIFERLQKRLDLEKRSEGISPLDLADLPPHLRKLMKFLLREVQMFQVDILKAVAGWPERDRIPPAEVESALKTLSQQGWLICRGEGERVNYQVNMRRKAGSKIAQGIWGSLDAKIAASKAAQQAAPPEESKPE